MSRGATELQSRLQLMVISDRRLAGTRDWLSLLDAALSAGATAVQLRDKEATSGELLAMAESLRPVADRYAALFLVNDRFDVALASGAHGVHLGDDDLPVAEVRRVAPKDFIIGRSADTVAAARAAEAAGADYLGVGSVFGTRTKKEVIGEVIGTNCLRRIASSVSIPIVGIGGVSEENAAEVARTGAAGIAVVSAIMSAPDPGAVTRNLLREWKRGKAMVG